MQFPWKKSCENKPEVIPLSIYDRVRNVLNEMEAIFQEPSSPADHPDIKELQFSLNNEDFIIFVEKESEIIRIIIPTAICTDLSNINEVRFIINRMNSMSVCHSTYMNPDDFSELVITVMTFTMSDENDSVLSRRLARSIEELNSYKNEWQTALDDLLKQRNNENPYDFEANLLTRMRKLHLIRMSESFHSQESLARHELHEIPNRIPSLSEYLKTAHDYSISGQVTVFCPDGLIRTLSPAEANSYHILDDMTAGNHAGGLSFAQPWIMIRVNKTYTGNGLSVPGITVTITEYGKDRKNRYVNIVSTTDGNDPADGTEVRNRLWHPVTVRSVIAVPIANESSSISEFEYMLADAREKIMEGKDSELSPEQTLLMRAFVADTGYHLYHGTVHFLAGRWLQAAVLLSNVFEDMSDRYQNMDEAAKDTFNEVCFMLGHCYTHLNRYREAYYYLSLSVNHGNFIHDRGYIDCLVSSGDFRAAEIIENAIKEYESANTNEELPHIMEELYQFLRRRLAYVYIHTGRLDEAENLLKVMVGEQQNREFAIGELAYIKRLREE